MKNIDNSEKIKKIMKALDLNQAGLASKLDLSQGVISEFASGTRDPSKDFFLGISKLGISLDWFVTGEGEMFLLSHQKTLKSINKIGFKRIPIYSEKDMPEGSFIVPLLDQRLSAGGGSYLPEKDEVTALVHVPAYLSRYGDKIAALPVEGDSMYPTLSRGDMVVCDSMGWSGEGIYALRMGGEGFVKRITKMPGKYVIISDNPKYPPQEEPAESQDIEIIGRVHCAITRVE